MLISLWQSSATIYFLSRAPSLFGLFTFSHKRFKKEEGSCSISYYLPCLVYLLSITNALRTRKVHVYFFSPVHASLPFLFALFAFSPASALRARKVHVFFLSPVHAFLPSLFGLFAFSFASASRTRKVHVFFPFSCTRFSTFPVRSHHYFTLPTVSQIVFR